MCRSSPSLQSLPLSLSSPSQISAPTLSLSSDRPGFRQDSNNLLLGAGVSAFQIPRERHSGRKHQGHRRLPQRPTVLRFRGPKLLPLQSKSLIKPTRTRLDALLRREEATQKFLKGNLAQLLSKGHDVDAYGRGQQPDFSDPVVLSADRGGCSVEDFCNHIHRSLVKDVKYVLVWGISARHYPHHCGLAHVLLDEDVVQIVKKKATHYCFRRQQLRRPWLGYPHLL